MGSKANPMKALVTGGGGFLGAAIVRLLVKNQYDVRSFSRSLHARLDGLPVAQICGDIADEAAVTEAAFGCDVVFHVAAKAGVWGSYEDYFRANVVGTKNVLASCRNHGINRLVYTSTPSVVHSGGDVEGVDESAPYAERFSAPYPETKAIAEKMVLEADSPELATVALRPHLVWGPGDNNLVPRIVERQRTGALRLVGRGDKLVDSIFVDNAADAHVLAAERLASDGACSGKAYFISQGEPWPIKDLINGILDAAGLPPVTRSVSPRLAFIAGAVFEGAFSVLGRKEEPRMTRFLAEQLATAHWYDISGARQDLGYSPKISIEEGLTILKASFEAKHAQSSVREP